MAETDHYVFEQPDDVNGAIWRYMDFTKFVAMLDSGSLYFPRVDNLADPFEGSYPETYRKIFERPPNSPVQILIELSRIARKYTFVNCWHYSLHESEAMWRLYTQRTEAIAIQSSYATLCQVLPKKVFIGMVKYIDYDQDSFAINKNVLVPFMHKRISFEHEREVRALIDMTIFDKSQIDTKASVWKCLCPGYSVPIRIEDLIECVYVAPTAPNWFLKLTKNVLERYGLAVDVRQSSLAAEPYI